MVEELIAEYRKRVRKLGIKSVRELAREEVGERVKIRDKISASVVGDCPVAVVLYMNGEEREYEPSTLLAFSEGASIHRFFQALLKDKLTLVEERFENEYLVGHIDGVYKGELIEVKSARFLPGEIGERYLFQVSAYFDLTGLNTAHVIFIQKDDLEKVRVFTIEKSKERQELLHERIRLILELNEKFRNGTLTVEELESVAVSNCADCPMKRKCPVIERKFEEKLSEFESWIGQNSSMNFFSP